MNDNQHDGAFSQGAIALAEQTVGISLHEADRALDDARRLVWTIVMTGGEPAQAQEAVGASETGQKIATLLLPLSFQEAMGLLEECRRFLWMQNFARQPHTKFGQAFIEHVERPDAGPLN